MKNKQVRVSPNSDGGWRVHKSGSERDSAHTGTKKEAIDIAERIAENQGLETKIQNKKGQITGGNSYGNDPCPPIDHN